MPAERAQELAVGLAPRAEDQRGGDDARQGHEDQRQAVVPLESEPKPVSVDGGVMAGVGVSETTVGVGVEAVVQASTLSCPEATVVSPSLTAQLWTPGVTGPHR